MTMTRAIALLFLLAGSALAAEPDTPVAVVNGEIITLRSLEDQLLESEGKQAILQLVEAQLEAAQWDRLSGDDIIVAMGNWALPRDVLAAQLLKQRGGAVRDELIQISLIEQALRKEGIVIGRLLLDAERQRMEERFQAKLVEMGQPQVPFDQYIAQTQGMTLDQFMDQPGFRMLAGLHALVLRRAEIEDQVLRDFHREHRDLFSHPEQVRLGVIMLDFQTEAGPDGRPRVVDEHRERLRVVSAQLYRQSLDGKFARTWESWGKQRDPQAGPGGEVGWVGADGQRSQPGAPDLPRVAMERAFRVPAAELPKVLQPIEHPTGILLLEVRDRRPPENPGFDAVQAKVRRAYLEANMEEQSRIILTDLRREADIQYEGLGRIVHEQDEALKRLAEPGLAGDDEPGADDEP